MTQFKFNTCDKVKRIRSEHEGMKVGDVGVVKSFENRVSMLLEGYNSAHDPQNFELVVEDEKEITKKFLCEQKWFIRTGNPEKSKLVQEWLFEHGCEWLYGKKVQTGFNDKLITNTNCVGNKEKYIMFSMADNKTNAQEIVLEFQTVVKAVKLPEVLPKKTEAQLKLEELQRTIEDAQRQIAELKEEI